MTALRYDAVIIGAGPAGGTAALVLARAGWSVALVEKAGFPRRKVCGEFMSATNDPIFAALGIAEELAAHSGPRIERLAMFARDAVVVAPMPKSPGSASGWGRAISRATLDPLLLQNARAAGAIVYQPWTAIDISGDDAGHQVVIESKTDRAILSAAVVIAAHGSWETGRLATQFARPHSRHDLLAFKAYFRDAKLDPDLMPLFMFPGGYGGMVTGADGLASFTCCVRRDALQNARAKYRGRSAGEALLAHIAANCSGIAKVLGGATLDQSWLAAGPINPGIRSRYEAGVFRVGNLAGEAHPVIAEGISIAMQSGWILATSLALQRAKGGALSNISQAYPANWLKMFAGRIRAAHIIAHAAMRPAIVSAFLPLFRRVPALLTLGAQLSGKTQQIV